MHSIYCFHAYEVPKNRIRSEKRKEKKHLVESEIALTGTNKELFESEQRSGSNISRRRGTLTQLPI